MFLSGKQGTVTLEKYKNYMRSFYGYGGVTMKKKSAITITAVLTASMVMSVTAFGAPRDIQGHWAQNTINKWVDKGDISGYPDGTFRPNNMITRAEFVVLVNNAMGYTKTGYAYFSDVPSYYWGKNAIQTGVEAGYISGDGDGTFRPNDPVTRQEAAAMISRILGLKQNDSQSYRYTDSYAISNWAKGVVGAVSDAGIMAGYPDGSFGPNRVLTRAEAVLALDKTINYKPGDKEDDKEETKKEDMLLTQTKLEDTTITGDLTISDRLGTKTVTLEDVTVKGKLIVDGGKEVILKDCDIKEMVMDQKDTTVKASGKTTVEKTTFKKIGKLTGGDYTDVIVDKELSGSITIDAKVRNLTLDAETDLKLGSDARIKNMEITKNADKATIEFSKAKVEDMTVKDKITIKGNGNIDTMTVYVSDVNTSIRPDTVKTKDGASKPNYTDDDDDWWRPNRRKSITVTSNHTGGTYRNVTVAATGVELKDTTVLDHLYIDAKVGNGTATLTNLSVSGNVYVNGGGDHSVIFENCSISGNIYAQKTDGSQQVALKFDEKTADKLKGSVIVKENGALLENKDASKPAKLQKVTVETANAVKVDTNVKEMQVTTANEKLTVNGTVDKLQADKDVTVNGNGRINEKTGNGQVKGDVTMGVTGVSLAPTEITLNVNGTTTLKATVAPENATDQTVTWESSDNQVATVENGVVTAKAPGKATITVKTVDGGKTATCTVNVNGPQTKPVTNVTLNKAAMTLEVNGTEKLTATVEPSDASNKDVTWESSKKDVATVEQDGTVKAVGAGEATIKVTAQDGSGKYAECKVTVSAPTKPVTNISLNKTELKLEVSGTEKLEATVEPSDASNKDVTWSSSNETVATVADGTVTAKAEGTATITVTTAEGNHQATCTVTVTPKTVQISDIQVQGTASLYVGDTAKLTATVQPTNATNPNVTWDSQNKDIATVTPDGTVTALKAGAATITATAQDGSGISGSFAVTVQQADTTALKAKMTEAQKLWNETAVSAQNGADVPPTKNWVPAQKQKDDLKAVMDAAQTVLTKAGTQGTAVSQDEVNTAYTNLQKAITTFKAAMKPGTKAETPAATSFWNFW